MFCKYCGKQIPDGAKFCPACGKPVGEAARQNHEQGAQPNQAQQGYSQQGYGQQNYQQNWQPDSAQQASGSSGMSRFLSIIGPQPNFTVGSYFVWGGCLLSFISLYLNFYEETVMNEFSITFMDMDYSVWLIVLLVAVAILNIFKLYVGDIIGAGIMAIMVWNYVASAGEIFNVVDSVGDFFGTESLSSQVGSFGVGLYLMVVGLVIVIGGAIYGLVKAVQAHKEA